LISDYAAATTTFFGTVLNLGLRYYRIMLKILALYIFWLPSCLAQLQSAGNGADLLAWNEFYKLQWYDFKGSPGEGARGDAGTAVQIKAKPYLVKREVRYEVNAFFNRKKSWSRDQSPALLAHEQLHFDIAELYARKIRKKIEELQRNKVNDIKTFNAAIEELLAESNQTDIQYDAETLHGALAKKQAEWAAKVKQELGELDSYKKRKSVIRGNSSSK
jgi:hypothetical protein